MGTVCGGIDIGVIDNSNGTGSGGRVMGVSVGGRFYNQTSTAATFLMNHTVCVLVITFWGGDVTSFSQPTTLKSTQILLQYYYTAQHSTALQVTVPIQVWNPGLGSLNILQKITGKLSIHDFLFLNVSSGCHIMPGNICGRARKSVFKIARVCLIQLQLLCVIY